VGVLLLVGSLISYLIVRHTNDLAAAAKQLQFKAERAAIEAEDRAKAALALENQAKLQAEKQERVAYYTALASRAENMPLVQNTDIREKAEEPSIFERSVLLAVEALNQLDSLNEVSPRVYTALRIKLELLPRFIASLPTTNVRFGPNGRFIASEGSFRVWNSATGKELSGIQDAKRRVTCVAFSPVSIGSLYVAAGAEDGTINVWNLETQKQVTTLRHESGVEAAEFSPDGHFLISAGQDRKIRLWDTSNWRQQEELPHPQAVWSMAVSRTGKYLAGSTGDQAYVWRKNSGGWENVAKLEHAERIFSFTPSENALVILTPKTAAKQMIEIVNWQNGTVTERFPGSSFSEVVASEKGLLVSEQDQIQVLDSDGIRVTTKFPGNALTTPKARLVGVPAQTALTGGSGQCLGLLFDSDSANIEAVLVPPVRYCRTDSGGTRVENEIWDVKVAGKYLTTTIGDNETLLWENPAHSSARWLKTHDTVNISFLAHGTQIGIASNSEAQLRDFATESTLARVNFDDLTRLGENNEFVTYVREANDTAFSKSGRYFGLAGREGAWIYELTGLHRRWQMSQAYTSKFLFSGDDRYAIIVNPDQTTVFDLTSERLAVFTQKNIRSVAFSPDSKFLASGSVGGEIKVCRTAEWQHCVTRKQDGVLAELLFSDDGQQLLTLTDNVDWEQFNLHKYDSDYNGELKRFRAVPSIRVWQSKDWTLLSEFPLQKIGQVSPESIGPEIGRLVLSPDKHHLGMLTPDGYKVYSLPDWKPEPVQFAGSVTVIAFSSDNRFVVTGGIDQTARVWSTDTWKQVAEVDHTEYISAVAIHPDSRYAISASPNETHGFLLNAKDLTREACARLLRDLTADEIRTSLGQTPYGKPCGANDKEADLNTGGL